MNKFVTNKSKLPQDEAQLFSYIGDWLSCEGHMIANHPKETIVPHLVAHNCHTIIHTIYGVICHL